MARVRRRARRTGFERSEVAWARVIRNPQRAEGARIFRLTLGYYGRGRGFADRVFADWSFADGPLTNWRGLDNRLRTREVRSNRRSYQSQRRSANDYKFQHEVPLLPLEMSLQSTLMLTAGQQTGALASVRFF